MAVLSGGLPFYTSFFFVGFLSWTLGIIKTVPYRTNGTNAFLLSAFCFPFLSVIFRRTRSGVLSQLLTFGRVSILTFIRDYVSLSLFPFLLCLLGSCHFTIILFFRILFFDASLSHHLSISGLVL